MGSCVTRRGFVAGAAALSAGAARPASAQALPTGTLRMLIGFPAGGGSDVMGRLIADKMRQRTGANIVIENKTGASGMIAAEQLKNGPADGSVVMFTPSATLAARLTNDSVGFDPQKDFATTGLVGTVQTAFAVSPTLGVNTFPEYVEWVKRNPGQANFGTTALGSFTHFVGVMLGNAAGVKLEPVPYRGAAPLVADLSGGHIAAGCGGLTDFLEHHRGGKLRIVVTAGGARAQAAPEIPTAQEIGYKDILIEGWYTFFAPARTPKPLIDAWSREIAAVVADPVVRDRLVTLGLDPQPGAPDVFAERMDHDLRRWKQIIDAIGYKPT
ncbi:Twin-arginine translocation pathway signal [Vineibacter terrae]|uniref:Twin-arginine translocation pathway signal n=1 Tax=Vineibacter terrae TaxID=2586908 RepID=A0A5C8PAU2_9HYPH|nr:tripartite tricarboxylate transporter substrate-binding protein [Vineibacter terrae]TXL70671.1 Twin-arginine translocation pathway signal [Vineibacter terrae]